MNDAPTGNAKAVKVVSASARVVALLSRPTLRDAVLGRGVADAERSGAPLLVMDGTGAHAPAVAGRESPRTVRWLDADDRHHVVPLGPWADLPGVVGDALARLIATWLRPAGSVVLPAVVDAALLELATLAVRLPGVGLYGLVRWLDEPGWRKRTRRAAAKARLHLDALNRIHPRTPEGRLLKERVRALLSHDDGLDRAFACAPAGTGHPWLADGETTVVTARSLRAGAGDVLLWAQAMVAASTHRGQPPHLWLIDPPAGWLGLMPLFDALARPVRVRLVLSRRAKRPLLDLVPTVPAVVGEPGANVADVEWIAGVEPVALKRRVRGAARTSCWFLHRHGAPIDRVVVLPLTAPPVGRPAFAAKALSLGDKLARSRHEVHRQRVALERRGEARRARRATLDLLPVAMEHDRLVAAWRRVASNKGAAGADGVTVGEFAAAWQTNLAALRQRVLDGTYMPKDYRRLYNPKPSGGHRPMSIPCVADRVLQGAVAEVLSEHLEPGFSDASFGYRPGRGAQRAVLRLCANPITITGTAIVADIASYFDTIDHRRLIAMLRHKIADERLVALAARWISACIREEGVRAPMTRGVPQGAPISPVLSNLYLTPLDDWMTSQAVHYVRYADDFIAVCESTAAANALLSRLERFLGHELRLSLKPAKTWLAEPDAGFDFLGFHVRAGIPRIMPAKMEDLRAHLLALASADPLPEDVVVSLDAWVRGVRNYYDLGTDSTAPDLQALEAWRCDALEVLAPRLDVSVEELIARTERFVPTRTPGAAPTVPGTYEIDALEEEVPEGSAASGPPTSWAEVDRSNAAVRGRGRQQEPGCTFAGGHLEVLHHGAWMTLAGERLTVEKKGALLFEVPVKELRSVRVASYGLAVGTRLLETLSDRGVPVFFSGPVGTPWACMTSTTHPGSSKLLAAQAAMAADVQRAIIVDLVGAKVANQERLLRYYAKGRKTSDAAVAATLTAASEAMRRIVESLDGLPADIEEARRVAFSIEGRAAQQYWSAAGLLLGEEFPGRRTRAAEDPWNQCLNYGYAVLYAAVWQALLAAGLDPGVGVLHASPGNRAALVFDVIEPYRSPAVDRAVFGLAGRGWTPRTNRTGGLTTATRRELGERVGEMLSKEHAWQRKRAPLGEMIRRHASALAGQIAGGPSAAALRVRW